MNPPLPVGTLFERRFAVEAGHAIDFADEALPPVLCTPALVGFLERTAREGLSAHVAPGESSVGVEIELEHLAPTPIGRTVVCRARVVRVEGREVSFVVEAEDGIERIARGFHKRRVINKERFAARVGQKDVV
jgi:fluoroacetyl-CoA thioesterase